MSVLRFQKKIFGVLVCFSEDTNSESSLKNRADSTGLFSFLVRHFAKESACVQNPKDMTTLLNLYAARYLLKYKESDNNLHSIQQYIETHYHQKITLPSLAKYSGYTPNYISLAFRKQFGLTVIQYLNQIRLSAAYRLLTETNMTVQEIAEAVGYTDSNYFRRIFTQEYKCSSSRVSEKY